MTTPSKAETNRPHQRAHGDVERGFVSCYAKDEADAIFESLGTELAREKERSARLRESLQSALGILGKQKMLAGSYGEAVVNEMREALEL